LKHLKEMLDLKKKIEVAKKLNGKLEAAIAEVQRETGKSRSHLLKAWKFKWQDGAALLAKYSPQMP
jgi:basic membrane lipoprotein Med (substrate-binding protein (PBP1-ABC) superfamily)